jgi:hypothetical protein
MDSRRELLFPSIAAAALLLYGVMVARNTTFAVGGSDSSGYFNEARILAAGHLTVAVEPLRRMGLDSSFTRYFVPLGFREAPHGRIAPSYPAGLPLHFAAAAFVGGWERAPFFVSPLSAMLSLVVLYAIGRELGLSRWWSAAPPAILAAVPIFFTSAVQPLSDDLATFWALLSIFFALRSLRNPAAAFAAGIAFAIGVWVRPTNFLLALPLAFAMRWRIGLLFRSALAAAPFGIALMAFNDALFGSPLRNGYGTLSEMIEPSVFPKCSSHHLWWLGRTLTPVPLVAILALPFVRTVERPVRALLAVWFAVLPAFYFFYGICSDWWDMRFLLPGLPAALLATVLLLDRKVRRRGGAARLLAAAAVAAMVVTPALAWKKLGVFGFDDGERIWPETVAWAERQLPPDALVVTGIFSGTFYAYGQRFTIRWDTMDNDAFQLLRAYAANAGLHWYAVTSDVADAKPDEFLRRYDARWTQIGMTRDVRLWRLDD